MSDFRCSIILQGLYEERNKEWMIKYLDFTDDVIFVTWLGQSIEGLEELSHVGITVIELEDPGSILSYKQSGLDKSFNVQRRVVSYRAGLVKTKYDYCIISRTDIFFDAQLFLSLFERSDRDFGITNVNSLNPYRLFSEKRFLSFCDWLIVANKKYLSQAYNVDVNENLLLSDKELVTFSARYFGKVNSEQALAGLLLGQLSDIVNSANKHSIWHEEFLSKCCIVDWKKISLKSSKYKRFTYSWVSYYKLKSESDRYLIPIGRLIHLPMYILAKFLERR